MPAIGRVPLLDVPTIDVKNQDALRQECVRATFFLIGRNAQARPRLAQRELAEGHTVAYHSFSHPMLDRMPIAAAQADIDRGIAAVDTALRGGLLDMIEVHLMCVGGGPTQDHVNAEAFLAQFQPLIDMALKRRLQ